MNKPCSSIVSNKVKPFLSKWIIPVETNWIKLDICKIKKFMSFRTKRSGVRNLYVLQYQIVNQISNSVRNDNLSCFAEVYGLNKSGDKK